MHRQFCNCKGWFKLADVLFYLATLKEDKTELYPLEAANDVAVRSVINSTVQTSKHTRAIVGCNELLTIAPCTNKDIIKLERVNESSILCQRMCDDNTIVTFIIY